MQVLPHVFIFDFSFETGLYEVRGGRSLSILRHQDRLVPYLVFSDEGNEVFDDRVLVINQTQVVQNGRSLLEGPQRHEVAAEEVACKKHEEQKHETDVLTALIVDCLLNSLHLQI